MMLFGLALAYVSIVLGVVAVRAAVEHGLWWACLAGALYIGIGLLRRMRLPYGERLVLFFRRGFFVVGVIFLVDGAAGAAWWFYLVGAVLISLAAELSTLHPVLIAPFAAGVAGGGIVLIAIAAIHLNDRLLAGVVFLIVGMYFLWFHLRLILRTRSGQPRGDSSTGSSSHSTWSK